VVHQRIWVMRIASMSSDAVRTRGGTITEWAGCVSAKPNRHAGRQDLTLVSGPFTANNRGMEVFPD